MARTLFSQALLAAASTLLATAALAQPMHTAEIDGIAAKVSTSGSARVIVGLALATQPEGRLSGAASNSQRSAIRAAQDGAISQLLSGTAARVHAKFDTLPHFAAEVDAAALARLRHSPLVRSLQEDTAVPPSLLQSALQIGAPTAWSSGRTGSGWAVAVLDTGVDKSHPFLAGKVVAEACYSSTTSQSSSVCPGGVTDSVAAGSGANCNTAISGCTHGTHVAGIAAGAGAADGSHGVARGADVIAIQVFSHFPAQAAVMSYTSDQIKALERVYALRSTYQIAAVNMSLGGGQYAASCDASQPAIKAAIDNLRSVGIATVIASGNNGYLNSMSAPACVSSAISVGAVCDAGPDGGICATGVGGVASYSNIAPFVSLLAPGSTISSSVPGGGYAAWNGTSMAAPHVAGAWALVKQAQPAISVDDALSMLRTNGVAVTDARAGGVTSGMSRIALGFLAGNAHTLSVAKAGTGSGSVLSAPNGVICGSDCSEPYAEGTTVTLNPTPAAGSVFSGWSGECSGSGACTLTMTSARNVVATFAAVPYALSVSKSGSGSGTITSSPAGIACGATCAASFNGGAAITLSAVPAAGSKFTGWSGACTGTASTCAVSMTAARSVSAAFAPLTHAVSVARSGTGSGTVTSSPSGIGCGSTCTKSVTHGSTMTLAAVAAAGSVFSGWTGACSGTGPCSLAVTTPQSIGATFTRVSYTLTVNRSGSGTVTSAPAGIDCGAVCSAAVSINSTVTLTATPAAGYVFSGWSGSCTGGSPSCNLAMTAAATATASFARITHLLTTSRSGLGTGSVVSSPSGINCGSTCSRAFNEGALVTLTAKPAAGNAFTGWSGACSGTGTCTVTMSQMRSVSAGFAVSHYMLTASKGGSGTGTVASTAGISCGSTCSALVPIGSTATLSVTLAAESAFAGWSGACSGSSSTCTLTMSTPLGAIATFVRTHYTLSVTRAGTGTGSVLSAPAGIDCGSACKSSQPINSVVTLTPLPAEGSQFTGWSGACTGSGTCTVSMTAARSVSANFARITYTLAVSKGGTGAGSVSSSPSGIACGSACSKAFNRGTVVTLNATPAAGSVFAGWGGACAGTGTCSVTMSQARSVTASFAGS